MKINHSFILNSVNQRQFNVRKDDSLPPPENNTNPKISDSTPDTECVFQNDETITGAPNQPKPWGIDLDRNTYYTLKPLLDAYNNKHK